MITANTMVVGRKVTKHYSERDDVTDKLESMPADTVFPADLVFLR